MRTITINDIKFDIPTSWEDVISSGNYLPFMSILVRDEPQALKHLELFKIYSGFDKKQKDLGLTDRGFDQLAEQLLLSVFPHFDFLYDPDEIFINNPIPSFIHDGVEYVGPTAKLNNQTGYQWERTHHMQVLFDSSKDKNLLEQMVLTNYISKEAPVEQTPLPGDIIYGILLWYGKCEKWWSQSFPWLFPSFDPEEDQGFKSKPTGREIKDMIFKLSGSKLTSDWDVVRSRSRQDIIYALDEMEKERERIEAQQD